jgi:hypothetical protein
MKNRSKLMAAGAILIIVLVFASWINHILYSSPHNFEAEETSDEQQVYEELTVSDEDLGATSTTTTIPTASVNSATTKKTVQPTSGSEAVTEEYSQALQTYGSSGYRLQFVSCRATPGQLSIKTGQKFMLDNRDNISHKIEIGNKSYTVKAYGFAVVTAGDVGTAYITCDGNRTAKLSVQP